jgi:hypothetical protein
VPPEPALRDGTRDACTEIVAAATSREKGRVDALDVDAAVLHRLDAVGDLDQPARGDAGVVEGAFSRNFISATPELVAGLGRCAPRRSPGCARGPARKAERLCEWSLHADRIQIKPPQLSILD